MQLTKATWKGQAMKRLAIWIFPTNLQGLCVDFLSENKIAIENKLFICFLSQSWRTHKTTSHRYE